MAVSGTLKAWRKAAFRLVRVMARPVRTARGRHGVVVQPYRGYGSREEVFLIGRVFRQSTDAGRATPGSLLRHAKDVVRRVWRRGLGGAVVRASFGGAEQWVETDADGYFRVHLKLPEPPEDGRLWHWVDLVLHEPETVAARAHVYIPPPECRYVVISDIDDTVMFTGVANRAAMLWRLFVQGARSRVAFPGVAGFYRALHVGATGREHNPMLYVSRGPWGLYEILDEFFRLHRIPVGPILFLREWGVSWARPLPRRATDHKRILIDNMLALYKDLPFVLIGDSGQHDPEVYREIVDRHRDRVLAVYIRNVSRPGGARAGEIEAMAEAVARSGSALVLAADTSAMVEHALGLGLVAPGAVADVLGAARADSDDGSVERRPVEAVGPRHVEEAVERSRPPTVVVAPDPDPESQPHSRHPMRARR
ncbi:App1 family protein [Novispirillum sp. DQ9]|uniref:App1 family protein n=1 Tax=Novispirillum sp. DQ9 TaxID=3398612 RepID=UPI003C7D4938